MSDTIRVTVYLEPEAAELLTQRAGRRGKGEYISGLILGDTGVEGEGVTERTAATVARIEAKIDQLIAKGRG